MGGCERRKAAQAAAQAAARAVLSREIVQGFSSWRLEGWSIPDWLISMEARAVDRG